MLARLGQYLRLLAIWTMVLPFVGASLIANGVMPTTSANGVIMLVFCTGDDMVEIAVDAVTMEPVSETDGDSGSGKKADLCPFAALQAYAEPPHLASLHLPETLQATQSAAITETTLHAAAKTGLPPATGPPVLL